jgi:tetratricopeptide (TPR) repeat protein
MHDTPQEVQLSLAEFDRSQLPDSQRALQGDAFRQAVQQHLAAQFIGGQGAAEVVVTTDRIIIRWTASTVAKTLTERGVDTLKQGDYDKGIATLRIALQRTPDDAETLFNLAMALSDRGQLDDAVVELGPRQLAVEVQLGAVQRWARSVGCVGWQDVGSVETAHAEGAPRGW